MTSEGLTIMQHNSFRYFKYIIEMYISMVFTFIFITTVTKADINDKNTSF